MTPKEISAFYFAYSAISLDPCFTQLTKYMESLPFSLTATLHLEFLLKWAHIIIISLVQLIYLPYHLLISIAHTISRFFCLCKFETQIGFFLDCGTYLQSTAEQKIV